MFRKPKKTVKKSGIRSRISEDEEDDKQEDRTTIKRPVDDEDEGEGSTTALLSEAKKRTRLISGKAAPIMTSETTNGKDKNVMHQYTSDANDSLTKRKTDLVTSTVEIHSEKQQNQNQGGTAERGDDGIFRDKTRSKLLAGPIKATTHIRTTCRFDYQPGEYWWRNDLSSFFFFLALGLFFNILVFEFFFLTNFPLFSYPTRYL